jgi:hypothetical protein
VCIPICRPSISSFFKPAANAASSSSSRTTPSDSQNVARAPKRRKLGSPSKVETAPIEIDSEASSDVEIQHIASRNEGDSRKDIITPIVQTDHRTKTSLQQKNKDQHSITSAGHSGLSKYTAPAYLQQPNEQHLDTNGSNDSGTSRFPFPLLIAEEKDALGQIDEQEEKERKRRHERWQTRIGQGLVAPRRNSLPLDQAEEEDLNGEEAEFEMLGDEEEDGNMTTGRAGSKKTKTKAGAGTSKSVKPSKGKKKEEIGPSGMTYTPLEKQVRLNHSSLLAQTLCAVHADDEIMVLGTVHGDQGGEPRRTLGYGR